MNRDAIKDAFARSMKDAGFTRKGDSWYQESEDTVLVANLQRSNFGNQYYVNLAAWLKAIGPAQFPKEHQCHVRTRATSLDPDRQRYWETEVFNLEYGGLTDNERGDLIRRFLHGTALPFLRRMRSLSELRKLDEDGLLRGAAILTRAQLIIQN